MLTLDQKKALHKKHQNCGNKRGTNNRALPSNLKPKTKACAKMRLSMRSIHANATAVVEHCSANNSTGRSSSKEELDMKEALCKKTKDSSNRNNSALQHKQNMVASIHHHWPCHPTCGMAWFLNTSI